MMNRVMEVMQTVLPVFLMLVTGMVLRSRNIISREGINALKKVVVNMASVMKIPLAESITGVVRYKRSFSVIIKGECYDGD